MMPSPYFFSLSLAACFVLMRLPALAYLGGFEDQDGYRSDGTIQDVSVYNAGQFGTNNGGPGGILTSIASNTGLFVKGDTGNTAIDYGELVAHQGTGHTGSSYLVLRSSPAFGDTGNDGAMYEYSFDSRDFNGVAASSITTGQLTLDYWMCPQAQLFGTAQITRTEFLNGSGQTIFAIGTRGQDNGTASPVIQKLDENDSWVDAETSPGSGTFVTGNNNGWDKVTLTFDFDADWVSFDYFSSVDQLTYSIAFQQALAGGRALDYLKGIRFNAVANTEKNSYDDFSIAVPVPEPSSALMLATASLALGLRRRRR
jgi:PEP-CTERM motif